MEEEIKEEIEKKELEKIEKQLTKLHNKGSEIYGDMGN